MFPIDVDDIEKIGVQTLEGVSWSSVYIDLIGYSLSGHTMFLFFNSTNIYTKRNPIQNIYLYMGDDVFKVAQVTSFKTVEKDGERICRIKAVHRSR